MFCPNCQNPVEPGMKFCGECGCVLPSEPVVVAETEPVVEPVAEIVEEPVVEAVVEPVAEEMAEPVAEPVQELVEEVAEEPIEAPAVEEFASVVYCPNCAQVNQVGDRFCMACGCKLEGVAPSAVAPAQEKGINKEKIEEFAKKSAEKVSIFAKKSAEEAGKLAKKGAQEAKKLAEEGSQKAENLKKLPKPVLFAIIGVAAVVVILAAILLLGAVFGGGNENFALYLKDSEIFYSDFGKKDPAEITSRLVDSGDVDEYEIMEASYIISSYMALTDGGNRLFFPDKIDDNDEGVTLYYRDLGDLKKDAVKIDAEIIRYAVSENGKEIVYLKADGNLYRSDLKDKEKIASDVYEFYVSEDLKTVLYLNDEDTLYLQVKGKDKEKIVSDVESLEHVSEDLSAVYYTKDSALYVQQIGKDRVKIDEDVAYVINILASGEIYYTVGQTKEISMMDFVEDDMAEADEAMTEPVYPTSPEYPYYWEFESDEAYNAAYAEYELAYAEYERLEAEYWEQMDRYYEKENRDWTREELQNYTEEFSEYTLCYFDGKESVEILTGMVDSWVDDYAIDAPVAIASACELGDIEKVKLSEIEGTWDVSNHVYEAYYKDASRYLICGENAVEVELEGASGLRISNDGSYLTYLSDMDEDDVEGELYKAQIKKGALGKAEQLDEDVYWGCVYELEDGRLVYFKDVDENDYKGDLFIDGVEVDYDAYLYGVEMAEELGGVLYYTDWNEDDQCGTLKLLKGKKAEKIADDVYGYYLNGAGELVYLYDYSDRHCTGSLYIYNGGKAKKIDDDVIALLPDGEMYGVMHGYWYFW